MRQYLLRQLRQSMVPISTRPFATQSTSVGKPSRASINLKQAAYLQQFEGLPLSHIAKQTTTEAVYNADQVKRKLVETKWPASSQLLKFYEDNRDIFTSGKTEPKLLVLLFNQLAG